MFKIYQVVSGDTLDVVAEKANTNVDYLININGFNPNEPLIPGSYIIIPNNDSNFDVYTVIQGDSIYDIARKFGVNYKDILSLNGLKENDYIYPNQMIMIPKKMTNYYITRDGDTLDLVSSNLNSSVDNLIRQNTTIYLTPDQFLIYKKEENI